MATTPTWNARPSYTDAQLTARFGAGARLVRRGDGKWTIAGASPAPAASAPVPPAPATTPPTSFARDAGIQGLNDQLTSLPGIYNPQRLALYAEGGRSLTDQGYYDTAQTDVAATGADGSTSYKIVAGPDGRLYREGTNDIRGAANSRGMLFSSATREAEAARARDLNNARQSFLRGLSGQQDSITGQQTERATGLRSDLNSAQGEYADWRAAQPVPAAPTAPAPTMPTGPKTPVATAPTGPTGPNNPRATAAGRLVLPGPALPPPVVRKASYFTTGWH